MPTQQHIQGDGVQLNVITRGNPDNSAIVLVHGYPDNQHVWNGVAAQLAENWFVVTYDVRGAGLSDRPARSRDYRISLLANDLEAVVDAVLPHRPFHLVGHDWGSIQSWESVTGGPLQARILSYTTLSGPCLDHVGHWLRSRLRRPTPRRAGQLLRQLASSWYIGAFHLPWLAPVVWENLLGKRWHRYLKATESIDAGEPNPHQREDGRDGIRLYRANVLQRLLRPRVRYAHCPVQLIVAARDRYVGAQLFEGLEDWVPALYRREIEASHWSPLSQPDVIADFIDTFAHAVASSKAGSNLEAFRVKFGLSPRTSAPVRKPVS
ncbi:alpha/beta fold hydrolase [Marinobacter fonticola]|uniref:alpha/beta fold hydrolase n=1 Tax=Marinobacter fonticola TaxID=2603215 RepID=UPI0011E7954A|nr:alpha/beta fold hydrolase [Marinobacter fonticola]